MKGTLVVKKTEAGRPSMRDLPIMGLSESGGVGKMRTSRKTIEHLRCTVTLREHGNIAELPASRSSKSFKTTRPRLSDTQLRLLAGETAELLRLTRRLQQRLSDTSLGLTCEMISLQRMAVRVARGVSRSIRGVVTPARRGIPQRLAS